MKKIILLITAITIGIITTCGSITWADGGFGISEWVSGIHVPKTDEQNVDDEALNIAVKVINRVLSLTSVVAVIVLTIGGYKVLTAGGDDSKTKSGLKFIKNAAIGLLIIGLSWATVRLIFRFVGGMDGDHSLNENSGG